MGRENGFEQIISIEQGEKIRLARRAIDGSSARLFEEYSDDNNIEAK